MTQEEFFKRYTYNIRTDRIGGGGFGTVYKAYDRTLHREVAIKVSEVKAAAYGKVFSLKDEFDALKHLPKHPNIANYEELYSFEMPNGLFDYAIMQYYPDGNLTNFIRTSLSFEQKEDISIQLLEGVAFLHEHKVVHRDLKPGNILIVRYGEEIIPIITDFGLSKTADTDNRSTFSNSFGGGTARYSSPEQLQGKPLRMNTDLWSYGVVIYELFTGLPLFEAGSNVANSAQAELEIYNKIIHGDVGNRLSFVPDKWREVMECCLVVNPETRVKSAEELINQFDLQRSIPTAPSLMDDITDILEDTHIPDSTVGNSDITVPITTIRETHPEKKEFMVNGIPFTMVHIEGGTVYKNVEQDDGSIKRVEIESDDFWISETVVTVALWNAVLGDMRSLDIPMHTGEFCLDGNECLKYQIYDKYANYAAIPFFQNVETNFREFFYKLDQMISPKIEFRLPTETEWEYALVAGETNPSQILKFNKTFVAGPMCFFCDPWFYSHHLPKEGLPNLLDLYQMNRDAWEWCLTDFKAIVDEYAKIENRKMEDLSIGDFDFCYGKNVLHNSFYTNFPNRHDPLSSAHERPIRAGFRIATSPIGI